jgi:hypothetical protein
MHFGGQNNVYNFGILGAFVIIIHNPAKKLYIFIPQIIKMDSWCKEKKYNIIEHAMHYYIANRLYVLHFPLH